MKTGLSPRQRAWYFVMCKKAVAIRMHGRSTWTKAEEEQCRHEITREALGVHKSSTIFTERDFDLVRAHLLLIIQPHNVAAQINQVGQEARRCLWVIRKLMTELGKDQNFVMGVIEQIEDGVDPNSPDATWQRERERTGRRHRLDDLTVPELKRVISALRSIQRRQQRDVASSSASGRKTRIYHLEAR